MKEREKIIEQMHVQIKKLSDRNVMSLQQKDNTHQSYGQFNNLVSKSSKPPTPAAAYASVQDIKANDFEEEKIKDAVNFKNLMQTVNHSNGFANLHSASDSNRDAKMPNHSL